MGNTNDTVAIRTTLRKLIGIKADATTRVTRNNTLETNPPLTPASRLAIRKSCKPRKDSARIWLTASNMIHRAISPADRANWGT
jgi:hypothetical protein